MVAMSPRVFVNRFRQRRPKYSVAQRDALVWLKEAHTQAECSSLAKSGGQLDVSEFRQGLEEALNRYGCGERQIATRSSQNRDFTHTDWANMEIYSVSESPRGKGTAARSEFFEREVGYVFDDLIEWGEPPADIVHVTCTGYTAPSAAQRLVSNRAWGTATRVTHVYHMGCYAAFPALRIAAGLCQAPAPLRAKGLPRVDIAHTELCTLHLNPLEHTPEQLVVQSLFADGFIVYSVTTQQDAHPCFEVLALDEAVVPDSGESMRWVYSDWGMRMTLARDVPARLMGTLEPFVDNLFSRASVSQLERRSASFAIHPGGPKILSGAARLLHLEEDQVAHSRAILLECGNMSSATVPHIWQLMLTDERVPPGRVVVSLAFGPGLTMCGAVMRKVAT